MTDNSSAGAQSGKALKKFLMRRIVEPEIALRVWELIVLVVVELSMLLGWYIILNNRSI